MRHCRSIQHLDQLHAHLIAHGSSDVASLAFQLAVSYCALSGGAGHRRLFRARHLFDKIPDRDRFIAQQPYQGVPQ
uniref:Uncharacterized protein n=1 Tax=Aegilops tauschii subsp. strangulata TaxID=200361 RepID=A0A453JKE0_AEGTS